jgi:cell wall-associated NlpC family hydrolase
MLRVDYTSAQNPNSDPNSDSTIKTTRLQAAFHGGGQRKAIIDVAASYLGTPYGSYPGAMLCSDFTTAVYGEATGVWLPSDFAAQRGYGTPAWHLKRGDLLLYGDHVGIYWGNGQIIHSSAYFGYVVISDMDYLYGYIGARRIRG